MTTHVLKKEIHFEAIKHWMECAEKLKAKYREGEVNPEDYVADLETILRHIRDTIWKTDPSAERPSSPPYAR